MSLNLRKLEAAAGVKARTTHGVRAYLNSGKLPSGRAWKKVQAEVSELRLALIEQYGGDKIQPAVLALIESAIEGLMIQRLSSLYVKKAGILRRDSLKAGDLCLHSILSGQFVSYANLVRLNLEAAARLAAQRGPEAAPTIAEIIREVDAEKAQEAGECASARAKAGKAQGGEAVSVDIGENAEEIARPGTNGEAEGDE